MHKTHNRWTPEGAMTLSAFDPEDGQLVSLTESAAVSGQLNPEGARGAAAEIASRKKVRCRHRRHICLQWKVDERNEKMNTRPDIRQDGENSRERGMGSEQNRQIRGWVIFRSTHTRRSDPRCWLTAASHIARMRCQLIQLIKPISPKTLAAQS